MIQNETIFITGATSGFGRALAESCAEEKAKLIVLGRRVDRSQELQEKFIDNKIHMLLQIQ